ncbi:MAG: MFS transporter [Pseudomonadota bacterium]
MNPVRLLALGCGVAVASVYYAQPLLAQIAADLGLSRAAAGNVVAAGQLGYAAGLLLLVPLGDLVDPRRLIAAQLLLLGVALLCVAAAPAPGFLLAAMAVVGALAVVTQTMVAQASLLVPEALRGRAVGTATAGVVIGIVSARVLGSLLAEAAGWRAVFALSAVASATVSVILWKALPPRPRADAPLPYRHALASTALLFVREPVLRARGLMGLFAFAAITVLVTPLALVLSRAPWQLSTAQVGLFGLSGLAGACGAAFAGRCADAGAQRAATLAGLSLMLAAWGAVALLPFALWPLAVGLFAFDFALQMVHVSNQGVIYASVAGARSRLAAGYMVFYSAGCAAGAALSTRVYAAAGWPGVCAVGVACSAAALGCRWLDGRPRHSTGIAPLYVAK